MMNDEYDWLWLMMHDDVIIMEVYLEHFRTYLE